MQAISLDGAGSADLACLLCEAVVEEEVSKPDTTSL